MKQMMNEEPGASNLNLYFTHLKAKQTTKSSKFYVINNMSNTYKTRFSSRKNPKKTVFGLNGWTNNGASALVLEKISTQRFGGMILMLDILRAVT